MNYNFSKDLKAIREILELTQTELAAQLGVDQKTISRNETKKMNHLKNYWNKYTPTLFKKI